jgi:BlaI family transcriptional regulator, penicillinase repressor
MSASLGERELDVMAALWRDGPGTVQEVRERLPAPLAYNTVLTILRNLEAKAFVGHEAEGRLFRYFPAVEERAVRGSAISRIVDKLFRGSSLDVVAHMVEDESLSRDELRQLHQLIDERLSSGGEPSKRRKRS